MNVPLNFANVNVYDSRRVSAYPDTYIYRVYIDIDHIKLLMFGFCARLSKFRAMT